jgi:hypothetical protein
MESKFVLNAAATAKRLAGFGLAAALVACGGSSGGSDAVSPPDSAEPVVDAASATAPDVVSLSTRVRVFDADLGRWQAPGGRWYSYQQSDADCASGIGFPTTYLSPASCFVWLTEEAGAQGQWVGSTGPWWIDPNHMTLPGGTGLGFINVLAFTKLPAALEAPADLDDTTVTFEARVSSNFATVVADSAAGRQKGHVHLWFQTAPRAVDNCTPDPQTGEDCTRQSDYILTGGWSDAYAIDLLAGTGGKALTFRLSVADRANWTCLGRGLNVKYDCQDFAEALRNVVSVGFVIAPVASCPTIADAAGDPSCDRARVAANPGAYFNQGRFEHRGFKVTRNRARADTARRIAALTQATVSPADGWSPLRYAARSTFGAGSGLQISLGNATPYTRIGLASTAGATTFETVGPQLYVVPSSGPSGKALLVVTRSDSGAYDHISSTHSYTDGDTAGLHLDNGRLLFLRNGEVIYTAPSPCGDAAACELTPFSSTLPASQPAPDIYRY